MKCAYTHIYKPSISIQVNFTPKSIHMAPPRRNLNTFLTRCVDHSVNPPLIQVTDEPKFPVAIFGSSNNPTGDKKVCQCDLPGGVW